MGEVTSPADWTDGPFEQKRKKLGRREEKDAETIVSWGNII